MCGPEHQGFGGSKTILYDTRMVDVCCYTFVQTHRMSTTKNEPCCKWWALSDNDVSSCRFEDWNSSWEITVEEAVPVFVRTGTIWEISILCTQFAETLKLL